MPGNAPVITNFFIQIKIDFNIYITISNLENGFCQLQLKW